ncbi:MAG TPA: helix-turn-helix transcriptional regulator [Stellaceae bacterium]
MQLEISPSHLNLIEHNQRPVSTVLLLKLARVFDLDLESGWCPTRTAASSPFGLLRTAD